MEIIFRTTIDLDNNGDDYEIYSADIFLDGSEEAITLTASSDEVDYEQFRADIFEEVLTATLESAGMNLLVFDEEPFFDFDDPELDDSWSYDNWDTDTESGYRSN